MQFNPNSLFLFCVAGAVILFVIAQSIFFLVRAYRRGCAIGMDKAVLRRTVLSTAVFTVAPAVSILLGVITLAKFLGIPLPWVRSASSVPLPTSCPLLPPLPRRWAFPCRKPSPTRGCIPPLPGS